MNAQPTICGWLKDEEMCDFVDMIDSTEQRLDNTVFIWFAKERQASTQISGPVLIIQAQKLHIDLHINNPSIHRISICNSNAVRWVYTQDIDLVL